MAKQPRDLAKGALQLERERALARHNLTLPTPALQQAIETIELGDGRVRLVDRATGECVGTAASERVAASTRRFFA